MVRAARAAPAPLRPLPLAAPALGAGELPTLQQLGVPCEPTKPIGVGLGHLLPAATALRARKLPTLPQLGVPALRAPSFAGIGLGRATLPDAATGRPQALHGDMRGGASLHSAFNPTCACYLGAPPLESAVLSWEFLNK